MALKNRPQYTQIPNVVFDDYLPRLSHSALRVLLVICRKTLGWHKDRDFLSRRKLMDLTGLSVNSVRAAIRELVEVDLISYQPVGEFGEMSSFEIKFCENSEGGGSKIDPGGDQNLIPLSGFLPISNINKINIKKEYKKRIHGDYQSYLDAWNALASSNGLPKAILLTDARRRGIDRMLRNDADFAKKFCAAVSIIPECPFLLGSSNGGWRVDFDFLLREDKLTKILEGGYRGKKTAGDVLADIEREGL